MVSRTSPLWLRLFSGAYTLDTAAAADSSGIADLIGLRHISVPAVVGTTQPSGAALYSSRQGPYTPKAFGNYALPWSFGFGATWTNTVDPNVEDGKLKSNYDSELRQAGNAAWCAGSHGADAPFVLRAGVQRDLRWKAKHFETILWNKAMGRGPGADRNYIGVSVWSVLRPGVGFPVQRYSVFLPTEPMASSANQERRRQAEDKATQLLQKRNPAAQMHFAAYEFLLRGSITERTVSRRVCDTNFWGTKKCSMKTVWEFHRMLVGETHVIQWDDARVFEDDPTLTTGGVRTELTTRWTAPVITATTPRARDHIRSIIAEACGAAGGCGPTDITPPFARGQVEFEGHDALGRGEAACQGSDEAGGVACSSRDNPLVPEGEADSASLADVVSGKPGVEVVETAAQRALKRSGRRGGIKTESQLEWVCRSNAVQDSIRYVNGPTIAGDPPRIYTDSMRLALVAECLAGATREGEDAPSTQPDGNTRPVPVGAPRAGSARQSGRAPAASQPKRCYEFNGKLYCVTAK